MEVFKNLSIMVEDKRACLQYFVLDNTVHSDKKKQNNQMTLKIPNLQYALSNYFKCLKLIY